MGITLGTVRYRTHAMFWLFLLSAVVVNVVVACGAAAHTRHEDPVDHVWRTIDHRSI